MSDELMTIERLAPAAGVNWETVRRFADAADRFEHGAVACRVMAGLVLLQLRAEYGTHQGARSDLATLENGLPKLSWEDRMTAETRRSDVTCRAWMKMADAAKGRLLQADVSGVFRQLLEVPVSQLTDDQAGLLRKGVEQLVDGRSQLDFMESLGLLAPTAPKGGDLDWTVFIQTKHPELIKDGKIPARGKAGKNSKAIMEEFSKWMESRTKQSSKDQRIKAAKVLLHQVEDVLAAALSSNLLPLLDSHLFVPAAALSRQFAKRAEDLSTRKD
jgi:hypothetical protein